MISAWGVDHGDVVTKSIYGVSRRGRLNGIQASKEARAADPKRLAGTTPYVPGSPTKRKGRRLNYAISSDAGGGRKIGQRSTSSAAQRVSWQRESAEKLERFKRGY